MSDFLFSDFESVSAQQWKQQLQMGLKGADYNEALVWKSLEGIHVKPFYHQEDFERDFPSIPGTPSHWNIGQSLFVDDISITRRLLLDALSRGAEAVFLKTKETFDFKTLFESFPWESIPIYFEFEFLEGTFLKDLIEYVKSKNGTAYYRIDLVHHLGREGNWCHSMDRDHELLDALVEKFPTSPLLGVDCSLYQNAGANMVQQLAYALAHANEYLNHYNQLFQKNAPTLTFTLAVGGNYFFEIAKVRALRWLVASLGAKHGMEIKCHVLAFPSKRNKTLYDYNVNMLRTTTECMSAVLGGANTICNMAYDALYHKSNEFGERIGRNQLLILKAEGYFDWVTNPVDGTYYIEKLTQEMAEKALELFKDIEHGGGFLTALKGGTIQRKIAESAAKEQDLFDAGRLVLVGTNKYPNPQDRMKNALELFPFLKKNPRKTLIQPILEKRLSEKLEKERLENEP